MVNLKANTLRKILLAGTAIVAIGALDAGEVRAQTAVDVSGGTGIWASGGIQNDDGTLAGASAGANLNFSGGNSTVTVTNDATANDGSGLNSFAIGTITNSAGLNNNIDIVTGSANDLTVATGAIAISGEISVENTADDGDVSVTVGGDVQASSFSVKNNFAVTSDALDVVIQGDAVFALGASVSGGGSTGGQATATLVIEGDATFNSGVDIKGGSGVISNRARLRINGANTVFAGDVTLGLVVPSATTSANGVLEFGGTVAQNVSGNVNVISGVAGSGSVVVSNSHADGVTFNGTIGVNGGGIQGVSIRSDGNDQAVTFANSVEALYGIYLGDGASADTITVNFDSSAVGTLSVDGGVQVLSTKTGNVNVLGGNTVNQSTGDWTGIGTLAISGNTTFDSRAALTAAAITIDSGSALQNTAGLITGDFLNNGTIVQQAAANIVGGIIGTGTLDVDANTFVTSNLTQGQTNIAAATTLLAAGTINTDVELEGAGAQLRINAGGADTYIGNLTTSGGSGTGIVNVLDDGSLTAFNGNLGTADATLAGFGIDNDMATTTTLVMVGDIYADAVTIGESDILRFAGTSTQTVSGTIVSSNDNGGRIELADIGGGPPTVVFDGAIGGNSNITDFLGLAGTHAIFNADATFDGVFRGMDSTVTVASGVDVTGATQVDGDATTWNIGVSPTDVGQVVFTGDGVDLSNDSVNFLVDGSLAGVATLDDVFTGNMAAITAGAVVTDNSFLYDFSLVDDGNTVDVAVTAATIVTDSVENPGFAEAGEILLTGALSGSTNPEIIQLQAAIGSQSTQEGTSKAVEAVTSPNIDGGALAAGLALANQTANLNSQRLASLRGGVETAASSTGVSSGNAAEGLSVWTQGFGAVGDQDDRGGVSGYDMTGFGLAFGADKQIFDETAVVGLAVAYAHTQVDSLGTANAETTIDSYQIALYGDYDLSDRTYIAGQVNYVWSTNDTTRNPGGVSALSASGDYDSSQIGARVEVGHDFALGDLVLTPKALANYVYYDAGGYSETGAGGANLTVDSDAVNLFELGLGVDAAWDIETSDGGRILPVLSAGLRHDFVGDNIQASNRFQAGGPAFRVEGSDPAQTTFNIGAAISYLESEHWEVTADYDFEARSGYQSHNGFIRVAYRF